jgi:hypothetical protein
MAGRIVAYPATIHAAIVRRKAKNDSVNHKNEK